MFVAARDDANGSNSGSGRSADTTTVAPPMHLSALTMTQPTNTQSLRTSFQDLLQRDDGATEHDRNNKAATTNASASASEVGVPSDLIASTEVSAPPLPPPATKPKKKRIRIQTEQRREQCRRNQARYRNKQQSLEVDLQIAVERLRLQVLQLEEQRRTLYVSINTRDSATRVAMEYFRLFRYGLQAAQGDARPPQQQLQLPAFFTSTESLSAPSLSVDTQLAFVSFAFDDNMRVDDAIGRDMFVEQSRRFAAFYDDPFIELTNSLDWSACETSTKLHTTERLELTVSPTTIRQVFPHLLLPQHAAVRNKVLGKRLECIVNSMFVFDMHGKVVQLDWNIDFVTALQKLLRIDETDVVLQQAQIVRDGYLLEAEDDDFVQMRNSDTDVFASSESRSHWYEERRWDEVEPTPHRSLRELESEADNYDGGVLIHDGKGDDYVMV